MLGECRRKGNEVFTKGRHGWLLKGNLPRVLPLLHKCVEERVGERRFWTL
jgi:hypothetical protein